MRICYIGDPRSIHTQRWVTHFSGRHDVALLRTAPDESLPEVPGPCLPSGSRLPGSRLIRSVAAVRRFLRAFQPDLIHAHYINEAGWLAAASAGRRPFVLTAWGSDVYRAPQHSLLARRLNPWTARRADYVTCDSRDQALEIARWGVPAERLSVIGWGVDLGEFHTDVESAALRQRLDIPSGAPVILSPRQWLANSNIPAIVQAHAQLPADVHLVLKRIERFEPDHGRAVAAAIAASPARDRIRVVGELPAGELPALYALADVVVSLCTTDGTPVSVLEAMALRKPIVAFDNASLREWVSHPGGVLLDSCAPHGVADAVRGFLTDVQRRNAAAVFNRRVVEERADRAREMGRVEVMYQALAAGSLPQDSSFSA